MKIKSICVPISPDTCGSVIHGYIRYPEIQDGVRTSKKYINHDAKLSLSDCSRVVSWDFYSEGGDRDYDEGFDLAKLDRAIAALCEFRSYMAEAQMEFTKLKRETEEFNKTVSKEPEDASVQLRLP